jgi:hypothetical protein
MLETGSRSRKAGDWIRISEGWRHDPDPAGSQRSQEPDPALDNVIQKCEKS